MDRNILKQLRRVLFLESFYSGTSSLSKVMKETEDELEDMMKLIDDKTKAKDLFGGKLFKK